MYILDVLRVSTFSFLVELYLWIHHKNALSATYMHNVQSPFTAYTPAQPISGQKLKFKQQRWRWRWRSEEENIQGRWILRLINTCKTALDSWSWTAVQMEARLRARATCHHIPQTHCRSTLWDRAPSKVCPWQIPH